MTSPKQSFAVKLYGYIVRLYPRQYREEFGEEMEYVFSRSLDDAAASGGRFATQRLWFRTILDSMTSLIRQHYEYREGAIAMQPKNNDILAHNKVFMYLVLAVLGVLLVPLIAMQFSEDVDWSLFDFVIMGGLLMGLGTAFVIAARVFRRNRLLIGIALGLFLLYVWAELAVGIFSNFGS